MKSYSLDTSIIIDYLRGKNEAVELLNNLDGEISSSYFCLAELYEGVYRVTTREEIEEKIQKFFNSLSGIYILDDKVAEKFGELRAILKKEGNIIEDIDIFIAATCIVNNDILVTFNKKHFSHIKDLQIF